MITEQFHSAELQNQELGQLQNLESELGVVLVALEPDPAPANLSDEQLQRLRELEEKTGKIIVAYDS